MGITFLKSILNRMRGKQEVSRVSPSKTELVKSFKDDQERKRHLIIRIEGFSRFRSRRSWAVWVDIMILTTGSD